MKSLQPHQMLPYSVYFAPHPKEKGFETSGVVTAIDQLIPLSYYDFHKDFFEFMKEHSITIPTAAVFYKITEVDQFGDTIYVSINGSNWHNVCHNDTIYYRIPNTVSNYNSNIRTLMPNASVNTSNNSNSNNNNINSNQPFNPMLHQVSNLNNTLQTSQMIPQTPLMYNMNTINNATHNNKHNNPMQTSTSTAMGMSQQTSINPMHMMMQAFMPQMMQQ